MSKHVEIVDEVCDAVMAVIQPLPHNIAALVDRVTLADRCGQRALKQRLPCRYWDLKSLVDRRMDEEVEAWRNRYTPRDADTGFSDWMFCLPRSRPVTRRKVRQSQVPQWLRRVIFLYDTYPDFGTLAPPISRELRSQILQRDGYRCRMCGVSAQDGDDVRLEVDHIIPRSAGGTNDESNLQTLC